MEEKNHKERILQCAKDLFRRFGVRSVSMDDIAHHLGISKKTIYQYFSDKDDIIRQAMQKATGEEKEMLLKIREESVNAIEVMIRVHEHVRTIFSEAAAAQVYELQKYHATAWEIVNDFKHGFLSDFIKQDLQAGIADGCFRADINVDIIARIRLEEVTMAASDQIFPRNKFNHREVSDTVLEHFILGIATEKGRELYKSYKEALENHNLK